MESGKPADKFKTSSVINTKSRLADIQDSLMWQLPSVDVIC